MNMLYICFKDNNNKAAMVKLPRVAVEEVAAEEEVTDLTNK